MVLVELDSSAILVKAMKNCTSGEMICAYQHLIDSLKTAGIEPQHHVLDNKCSAKFKDTIKKNNMTFQLVHHMTIAKTFLRKQSRPSRHTLLQYYVARTSRSRSICGASSYPKKSTCSTCCAHLE
jgi:hypothetical protein